MGQTMGIYYDPEMVAAAGIDGEPETWDEMIEAANPIKSNVRKSRRHAAGRQRLQRL